MPDDQNYYTFFDLAQSGYRDWWFPATGLKLILAGILFVLGRYLIRKLIPNAFQGRSRRLGWSMILFSSLWTIGTFLVTYGEYLSLKHAEEEGRFSVVEGEVRNFHPMPYGGLEMESFEVNGVAFQYSDYDVASGFNNTASQGGPMRQGLPVRIAYYGNKILRLEIRADSVPSPAELSEFSREQRSRWQQLEQNSPAINTINQINFGFAIGLVIILIIVNLDWRHYYMRHWKRSGLPDGPSWQRGFRVFFLICLAGSAWRVLHHVLDNQNKEISARDYGEAGLFSLLFIGMFLALDGFQRWRWRSAKTRPWG